MLFKRYRNISEQGDVKLCECINSISQVKLNVYSFYQDGVLIDCGAHALRKYFMPFYESLQIDRAVVTHAHEDHDGCATYLAKKGIPIYVNEMSVEKSSQKANYPFYRKFFWGVRPAYQALPHEETFQSNRYNWRVIATPGHAADHVSFLNESTGQLYSGDLYVTPRTKLILREESIPQIIASIEKVLQFDFEEMFCCHAGYVKDGKQAFKLKLEYLLQLTDKVRSMAQEGYSVDEIHDYLFPRKYQLVKVSRGEWHSKNIITSILAHSND